MEIISTTIAPFGSLWWLSTIPTIAIIWISIVLLKRVPEEKLPIYEKGIFLLFIVHEVAWQIFYISTETWVAAHCLPLHLCGISRVIGAILLVRYNQYMFEFLMLLGFGGALQAFLTPEVTIQYNWFTHIDYYFNHGFIFFGGFYQFFVRKRKIEPIAWIRSFLIGLCVLFAIGGINYLIDGNYIYLCQKPNADNPLLIGPWPYYLSGFLGFGFINIVLFHFLFRWWGKKIEA